MNNKAYVLTAFVVALLLGLWICVSASSVDTDEYGVYVKKPILFGASGADSEVLSTGVYFHAATTKVRKFKKNPTTLQVPFDDLATNDNNLLDFRSSVTFIIADPVAMASLSDDWFDSTLLQPYANIVRRTVMGISFTKMMADAATNEKIDAQLTGALRALVKENNLPVRIVDVSLGKARPNDKVLEQMNATAAEQQRQKTMEQRNASEILRKTSEESRADADLAYRNKMGMSISDTVELQKAQIYADACKANQACYLFLGQSGGISVPVK